MASLNRVFLIGNLGADPEVRYTPGSAAVANFRIATTEVWNSRQTGERQERTEWHRIVVWGKQAEACGEYLKKGRSVFVEGRLQTREWTDKEQNKRYTTEIVADRVQFLGGGGKDVGSQDRGFSSAPETASDRPASRGLTGSDRTGSGSAGSGDEPPPFGDDDIPF